jgi:hypothetical protein
MLTKEKEVDCRNNDLNARSRIQEGHCVHQMLTRISTRRAVYLLVAMSLCVWTDVIAGGAMITRPVTVKKDST